MARGSSKKRVLKDDVASTGRANKRAKNASGSETASGGELSTGNKLPKNDVIPPTRELNRLQRAIPSGVTTKSSSTTVLAKRLKKAEKEKGMLAALIDAPLDILFEISLYLSPTDLLCLSRVSRQLREYYMSKCNRQIWINSLASTNLPPCPDDLSEPQYASLVLDTDCMACNKPHIKSLDCILRLRMCKDCFLLNVVECDVIVQEFVAPESREVTLAEADVLRKTTTRFMPSVRINSQRSYPPKYGYYRPDFEDALSECLQQHRTQSAEDFQKFVKDRVTLRESTLKQAEVLQKWVNLRADIRASELMDLARTHAQDVKSRLRKLGYTNEDWNIPSEFYYFDEREKWEKLVHQKRALTERTWKNLFPKLEEFLADLRKKVNRDKRSDEFDKAYGKYYRELQLTSGERELMPSDSTLRHEKVVEDFIYHNDYRRPITDKLWKDFFPVVKDLCERKKLDALMGHDRAIMSWRAEHGKPIEGLAPLQHILLASSFFLGRSCCYYYFDSAHSIAQYTSPTANTLHRFHRDETEELWYAIFSEYNLVDISIPDALLGGLGLSLTTTMLYMQQLGERFICSRCGDQCRKVMGWSALVEHYTTESNRDDSVCSEKRCLKLGFKYIKSHALEGESLARILTDAEVALELQKQDAMPNLPKNSSCNICRALRVISRYEYDMTQAQVEEHIRIIHEKEPAPEDVQTYTNHINAQDLLNFELLPD